MIDRTGKQQTHMSRLAPFGAKPITRPSNPEPAPVPEPPKVQMLRPVEQGTPQQINGYVKVFRHYGCYLDEFVATNGTKQLRGTCPFPDCNKEEHFFARPGTGQWDCKKCQRAGNIYDFIRTLHECYIAMTTDEDYASLANERQGIKPAVMKHWQLAYNLHLGEWMIPTMNKEGKITNIHVWREFYDDVKGEQTRMLLATPSLSLGLYGMQQFQSTQRNLPTWILEGHWDAMAFHTMLMHMNLLDNHRFLAMPGAGTFPKDQLQLLSGSDVRFVLDNDDAGKNGTERIFQAMGSYGIIPSKLSAIEWPSGLYEGFDVRDVAIAFSHKKKDPPFVEYKNPLLFMSKNLQAKRLDTLQSENEGYDPEISPEYCPTFETLVDSCRRKLHFTDGLENTLAVMLAVNVAVNLGGNPLWTYVVGPPSSGKTTLADIMASSHPYCISKSKINGLFSGWKGGKKDEGKDYGMLPMIQGKTLIVKDFTTILALPPGTQEQLFSQLRDAYDGDASTSALNGVSHSYKNIRFGIVACTTDEIRAWSRTALGERFLHCEIDSHWDDNGSMNRHVSGTDEHMLSAMRNTLAAIAKPHGGGAGKIDLKEPKSLCWGLLEYLHTQIENDRTYIERITDHVMQDEATMLYISDLSKWCGLARTNVNRGRDHDLAYRPRAELGLRLASQLVKLTIALCMVFQINEPNTKVIDIIRKVALDTSVSFTLEIMLLLAHRPHASGMTKEQLCMAANLSPTQMGRWLNDMMEIGIITSGRSSGLQVVKKGQAQFMRGRPENLFTLAPNVQLIAENLGFSAPRN